MGKTPHCSKVAITNSRSDTSPLGCGIALSNCTDVSVKNCETARNGWCGIMLSESSNISITGNLIEANDAEGVLIQYLYAGCSNILVTNNLIHYNQGFGVASYASKNIKAENNSYAGNGVDLKSDEKISSEKFIIM